MLTFVANQAITRIVHYLEIAIMCFTVPRSHVLYPGPDAGRRNLSPLKMAKAAWRLGYPFFTDRVIGGRLYSTPLQEPNSMHWHSGVYHSWAERET